MLNDTRNRTLLPAGDRTRPATPVLCAADRVSADVRLALLGGKPPFAVLGDSATGEPPAGGRVRLPASDAEAAAALAAGELTIADAESAPLALLAEPSAGTGWIEGRLSPSGPAPVVAGLPPRTRPGRIVAVLARPLTDADLDGLRSAASSLDADVVVAIGSGPTPDGLPPTVLRRCVDELAVPWFTVVEVPLGWRAGDAGPRLAQEVVAAVDGTHLWLAGTGSVAGTMTGAQLGTARWTALTRSLREATTDGRVHVDDQALGRALPFLTRWLPPRNRRGLVVFFTGLSGAGKSTLARGLVEQLRSRTDRTVTVLDGDVVRRLLSAGLGFDRAGRDLNIRRIGFVAAEVARHGGIAVCAPIAPYAESRAAVRELVEAVGDLVLVHVSTPLAECERRDVKGLYAKARAGLVGQFTGVSDDYDLPTDADLRIDTSDADPAASVAMVVEHLRAGGWIAPAGG